MPVGKSEEDGGIHPSYASYGDSEFLARKAELSIGKDDIHPENDWSADGSNWKE